MITQAVPEESAKIAIRRAHRVAEKITQAKIRLKETASWRGGERLIAVGGGLIFSLNLFLVWPFFGTEAYPTSYSGPGMPFMAKLISLSGLPLPYSMEIVNIIFFLVFSVSFFLLVKKVSGKAWVALLAGLIASLPFSPFAASRIQGMFFAVEGPHIASLSLVPLAIYGLMSFLRSGGLKNLVLTALASAAVGLISPFGLLAYVIFSGLVTFSEILLGRGRLKLGRVLAALVLTGGLSSFWYNPAFFWWLVTGPMGQEWRQMLVRFIPLSFFIMPVLGVFGYLLFDRKPDLQPLFLGIFLTIAFVLIVLTGRGIMPSTPIRYSPELGVAVAFLCGVVIDRVLELKLAIGQRLINLALVVLVLGLVAGIIGGRDKVLAYEQNVLGLWTGVERGHLWQAREQFGGGHSFLGWAITLGTITGLGIIKFHG